MLGVLLDIIEGSGGKTDKDEGVDNQYANLFTKSQADSLPGACVGFSNICVGRQSFTNTNMTEVSRYFFSSIKL